MSGSSNLDSFRDRRQVAVQLVSCGVLPQVLAATPHKTIIYIYIYIYIYSLVWFYGILTIVAYLMSNPLYTYILNIYHLVWFGLVL